MKGYKYAWQEFRLLLAQSMLRWAVLFTPANTQEFLLLYATIKAWKSLCDKRPEKGTV